MIDSNNAVRSIGASTNIVRRVRGFPRVDH
jgi:hypothetical protein